MEDFLLNPEHSLNKIYNFLKVEKLPIRELIQKLEKGAWKSNSSFGQKKVFDTSVIGNYKKVLTKDVIQYVEAICCKEMQLMDYEITSSTCKEKTIREFNEPFEIKRKEFDKNYTSLDTNVEYELYRSNLSIRQTIKRELLGL